MCPAKSAAILRYLSLPFLLLSITAVLSAQQPTGTISGVVTDNSGAVVSDAAVTIVNLSTQFNLRLSTTRSGTYTAPALLAGEYEVRVAAPGFSPYVLRVVVETGRVTAGDVRLRIGPASESIAVPADAVRVSTSRSSLEGVISRELIEALPLNGRNFLELGQLEPGAQINNGDTLTGLAGYNTGLGVAGQSGMLTRVTLDGLDLTDDHFGGAGSSISQEAIQEFQVSRSGLDISTGLTGSGAVNIVSRTGGNDVHGTGLLYWRDDALAARIAAERVPFDRKHFGFSAGGPFRRDRLFWFANYERVAQTSGVVTRVPFFPQYDGTWGVPYDERLALARMDANIASGLRAFARFMHSDQEGIQTGSTFGGNSLVPRAFRTNNKQAAAGLDLAGGRFTHAFRFGYMNLNGWARAGNDSIPGLPSLQDSAGRRFTVNVTSALLLGVNLNTPMHRFQDSLESRYDGGVSLGRHTTRWGGLVNVIRSNWSEALWSVPTIGARFDAATQAACQADLLCYPLRGGTIGNGLGWLSEVPSLGYPYGGFENDRLHAYLADAWRVTSRLHLSAGVRWVYESGQNTPGLQRPAVLEEFEPGLSRPDRPDWNNFAPQMGLAWDPTGSGKWVVRANAGLFYDTVLLRNNWWSRLSLTGSPVAMGSHAINGPAMLDPNTGLTIFDIQGRDLSAAIAPGRNWLSGCTDPRFPAGDCPLGTPGLLEAILDAAEAYRAAYAIFSVSDYNLSRCESTRTCESFERNFRTPYTLQFSAGVQRELRPGLVVSVDFVRHRGIGYILRTDANRLGAADTLDVDKAIAAVIATNASRNCASSASPGAIDCAIQNGATLAMYARNGLGMASQAQLTATGAVENYYAFDGDNPAFNRFIMYSMHGWSTYNALQVHLRGRLPDVFGGLRNATVVSSYALGRLVGTQNEQALIWLQPDEFKNMQGPTTLDRTHMFSLAAGFDTFGGVRLNSFWRAFSALPQSIFLTPAAAGAAEILRTDLDGDGTTGDPLPGTNRGSYGRDAGCGAKALNRLIDSYNTTQAGQLTPAGEALVHAGLFTREQLVKLGAVSPTVARAPDGQVCLDSFVTTDLRISRPFSFWNERIQVEPALEIFNLFNTANFDLPSTRLDGVLRGLPGSINGTTPQNRTNRAGATGGTMSLGAPRSWQMALRVRF